MSIRRFFKDSLQFQGFQLILGDFSKILCDFQGFQLILDDYSKILYGFFEIFRRIRFN